MKIQNYIVCATVLCAAAACSVKEPAAVPVQEEEVVSVAEAVAPGSATVLFDEDMIALIEEDLAAGSLETKSDGLNAVLRSLGIVRMERVFPDAGEYEERTRREGLHRFYEVEFDPSVPVTKAVDELSCVPGIEKVECHRPIALRGFNDPMLSRQWHYINTGTEGADVDVEGVWSNYTVGSRDVIVSVVDEGVCYTHPDLADNCWDDGSGHHGYNFVKSSYNITWSDASDVGHGTHVAGIISAVNNNGTGICGLAGGDYAAGIGGVRLMSCQIFAGDSGASDSGCGRAIKWGADHGALISQNSWGFYADSNGDGTVSSSELATFKTYTIPSAIKAAVDYFIKYAGCDNEGNQKEDSPMQGGLVIFAAGNENIDFDPICAYEPVISVGAFGSNGKKASYSNYGDWVDFGAPGGDGSKYILSTLPTNIASSGYGGTGWMGTSMACPHVSGVAALLTVARMFQYLKEMGKTYTHSVIFVALDGKEQSLGGSHHLWNLIAGERIIDPVRGTPVLPGKIDRMVNIDQVGGTEAPLHKSRPDYLMMLSDAGTGRRDALLIANMSPEVNLDLAFDYYGSKDFTRVFYRTISDQKPFLDHGIPSVMFTSGITLRNNKVDDNVDSLDYAILRRRVLAIFYYLVRVL